MSMEIEISSLHIRAMIIDKKLKKYYVITGNSATELFSGVLYFDSILNNMNFKKDDIDIGLFSPYIGVLLINGGINIAKKYVEYFEKLVELL